MIDFVVLHRFSANEWIESYRGSDSIFVRHVLFSEDSNTPGKKRKKVIRFEKLPLNSDGHTLIIAAEKLIKQNRKDRKNATEK